MMKISRTPTFKRNYKMLKKKHYDMSKLEIVIELLVLGEADVLYRKYKDHALKGDKQGLRELHIEKDWLLLYEIKNDILELWLLATGKHDDIL